MAIDISAPQVQQAPKKKDELKALMGLTDSAVSAYNTASPSQKAPADPVSGAQVQANVDDPMQRRLNKIGSYA